MLRRILENRGFQPSEWERSFLSGCQGRLRRKGALSNKQAEIVREIFARECR
jgi:hypothetical protein